MIRVGWTLAWPLVTPPLQFTAPRSWLWHRPECSFNWRPLSSCTTSQTEVPLELPLGAGRGVHYGSSARSWRGKGAFITALGDVMSRWPGATEEPVPSHNNPSFHPQATSTIHQPRPGGHTGLVKQREEEEVKRDRELFHWFKEGFKPHGRGLLLTMSSSYFWEKLCKESMAMSTVHTEMFLDHQSVSKSMWGTTDR